MHVQQWLSIPPTPQQHAWAAARRQEKGQREVGVAVSALDWLLCQRSQINEDTVEPSLAAQDINPIAYMPDLIFTPRARFVSGLVQLIRLVTVPNMAHNMAPQHQIVQVYTQIPEIFFAG